MMDVRGLHVQAEDEEIWVVLGVVPDTLQSEWLLDLLAFQLVLAQC